MPAILDTTVSAIVVRPWGLSRAEALVATVPASNPVVSVVPSAVFAA